MVRKLRETEVYRSQTPQTLFRIPCLVWTHIVLDDRDAVLPNCLRHFAFRLSQSIFIFVLPSAPDPITSPGWSMPSASDLALTKVGYSPILTKVRSGKNRRSCRCEGLLTISLIESAGTCVFGIDDNGLDSDRVTCTTDSVDRIEQQCFPGPRLWLAKSTASRPAIATGTG